jgi:hypothetical protein
MKESTTISYGDRNEDISLEKELILSKAYQLSSFDDGLHRMIKIVFFWLSL